MIDLLANFQQRWHWHLLLLLAWPGTLREASQLTPRHGPPMRAAALARALVLLLAVVSVADCRKTKRQKAKAAMIRTRASVLPTCAQRQLHRRRLTAPAACCGGALCTAGTYGALTDKDLLTYMVAKGDKASGGFGMNMAADLTITKISVPDGPADRAGVLPGVRIVEINGVVVSNMEEAGEAIRGIETGDEVEFRCIPPPMRPEQGHFRPQELWDWLDDQIVRWMPEGARAFCCYIVLYTCTHIRISCIGCRSIHRARCYAAAPAFVWLLCDYFV